MRPIALIGALVLSALLTPLPTAAQWGKVPTITLSALAHDPRLPLALEAVEFWNRQLAEIGTPFRLGLVTPTTETLPTDYLTRLSAAVLNREPPPDVPERVGQMPGDIIIALSDGDFISFSHRLPSGTRVMIGIRSDQLRPLNLPNVARNVIAHELGHAIGLRHNDDPTTLMCGRPAPCRPAVFQSDVARFFPLTEADKGLLLRLYPPTWTPTR
jgi:Matrixin